MGDFCECLLVLVFAHIYTEFANPVSSIQRYEQQLLTKPPLDPLTGAPGNSF